MDANAKRPWYRLHWGTAITVALTAMAWANMAFPGMLELLRFGNGAFFFIDGWPWYCISIFRDGGSTTITYDTALIIADAAVFLVSLGSVAYVVERLERTSCRLQLVTLFALSAVVAAMLGYWRWDSSQEETFSDLMQFADEPWPDVGDYQPLHQYFVTTQGVFYFGLGCTAFVVISVAIAGTQCLAHRLRRTAPAKVEADHGPAP
jgi:hypothetical protein